MSKAVERQNGEPPTPLAAPQHAHLSAALGPATLEVEVTVSPAALLAIGGMVTAMLLGSAAIVRAARREVTPRRT